MKRMSWHWNESGYCSRIHASRPTAPHDLRHAEYVEHRALSSQSIWLAASGSFPFMMREAGWAGFSWCLSPPYPFILWVGHWSAFPACLNSRQQTFQLAQCWCNHTPAFCKYLLGDKIYCLHAKISLLLHHSTSGSVPSGKMIRKPIFKRREKKKEKNLAGKVKTCDTTIH